MLLDQVIELPASSDFHVHLRDGDLMETVVPTIRQGGVNVVYVMPNLVPPIETPEQAIEYRSRLQALEPNVRYLMSLYLSASTTPEMVRRAKEAEITGIKCYPAGVTTNSASGVKDYDSFFPVFEEMEKQDLILNLHGECQSGGDINELNAEQAFLPTLLKIHHHFPHLRIVLEHCTTREALKAVSACDWHVAGTITAHHLFLTKENWSNDPFSFCKPVAKTDDDRIQLLRAVISNDPKFFFGSDSAPHSVEAKKKRAAGIFTQPYATQLVLDALDEAVAGGTLRLDEIKQDALAGFLGKFGRQFYQIGEWKDVIELRPKMATIKHSFGPDDPASQIIPFHAGRQTWSLTWK